MIALAALIYIATKPKTVTGVAQTNVHANRTQSKPVQVKTGITDTWTGKGKTINWSDPGNWSNGTPGNGDSLVFGAISGVMSTNNDLSGVALKSLTFLGGPSSGSNQIIVSGNNVSLSGGLNDNTTSSVSVDFNTGFVLTASQTFSIHSTFGVDPSSSPDLAGTVVNVGKYNLTVTGFSNSATTFNSLSGSGQLIVNLSQDNTGSFTINQASPDYSGSSQIGSGTLTIDTVQSLGSGTIGVSNGAQLVIASSGSNGSDMTNNMTIAGNGPNSYGAVVVSDNSTSFTMLGTVSLSANATFGFMNQLGSLEPGQVVLVNKPSTNGFALTGTDQTTIAVQ